MRFARPWPWQNASTGVFALGPVVLYILMGSLFLMAIMLLGIQWLKRLFGVE